MNRSEVERLSVLERYGILDTPAEATFDRLAAVAAELFDAPIALVSLVDAERQWFKAKVGLDVCSTDRKVAFCAHAIEGGPHSVMVVDNPLADPRFRDNPLVTGGPNLRFYAGAVLTTSDGHNLGTLCVIDSKKRPRPSEAKLEALRSMAALVVGEIELRVSKREVEDKQRLLELAETVAGLGRWRLDLRTAQSEWSEAVYNIYGVDRATFPASMKGVLSLCEMDEREKIVAAVEQAVATRSGFDIQFRFRRPDGGERHVVARAMCRLDNHGAPVALFGVLQDVTESARALRQAQTLSQRADMAERIGGLGHWRLDVRTRHVIWSPQMYVIYGLSPDHPLELNALMAMTDERDRGDRAAAVERLLAGETPLGQQVVRIHRPDGEMRYVRSDVAPEYGPDGTMTAVIGALIDITEQRRAQLALARSEASYRQLAENTSDMMLQCDIDGKVHYVAPSCMELTGHPPETVIGRNWQDFISPLMREAVVEQVRRQIDSGVMHSPEPVRYAITHADGREVHVEGRPTLIVDAKTGAVKGFNSMVRDVTRRHQAELALESARAEAEEAAAAKAVFLANMSHELRTPLTAVLGFSHLIAEQPDLPGLCRTYLDRVLSGGEALLTTVNDILDFSKLEAGQVTIKPKPCAPAALAREAIDLFGLQAEQKGLTLEVGGLEALPAWVMIDAGRVRQILLNLIGNAMKFTDAGVVRLELAYDPEQARLDVSVADTGPGIDQACADRLFNRFVQDDDSTHAHSGSGLGLAICKGLTHAMGGEIGLDSTPGEGARFWFFLPAPLCEAPAAAPAALSPAMVGGCRILVADDNPANRALVGAILGAYGAEITEACDGLQAVRYASDTAFDLILMDLKMPNEDGLSAARRLRSGPGPNKAVPMLAFSADVTADLPAGLFDGALAKPIAAEDLLLAATRALEPHLKAVDHAAA